MAIDLTAYDFVDFGCSTGESIAFGIAQLGGSRGLGLDLNPEKVAIAREAGYDAEVADVTALDPKSMGTVRFVIMSHFLEHLSGYECAQACIQSACRIAEEFVFVRQPYFDADGYLFSLGLKLYWSDWAGHPYHMTSLELYKILATLRDEGTISRFVIFCRSRIKDSNHPAIHPITSPRDQHEWEMQMHGPKGFHEFEYPIFGETFAVIIKDPSRINERPFELLKCGTLLFDSDGTISSACDTQGTSEQVRNVSPKAHVDDTDNTLPMSNDFNEVDYLALHPDVRAAVEAGQYMSGAEHYAKHGKRERRQANRFSRPHPPKASSLSDTNLLRRDKILLDLDLRGLRGVEIGPLISPLVTRTEGNILYVDHTDTDALRRKYASHSKVDTRKIVEIDAVWGAQTLKECLGTNTPVDYVIASHVIEHVPDFVTWLSEIRAVLRHGGKLRLAIPDRRFSFDYLRNETRLCDVLDAYIHRARAPLPRVILDHSLNIGDVDTKAAWRGELTPDCIARHFTVERALEIAKDAFENGTYHDVHCWVFTPKSFADLCGQLAMAGLISFQCDYFFDTAPLQLEFIVGLKISDDRDKIVQSWQHMGAMVDDAFTLVE